MNKRARLILSLIPIFILIPLLFGGFVAPTIEPGNDIENVNEVSDEGKIDPPPTLQFYSDTQHTNTTAVLTAIATDYLENAGIRWIKIYEDNQEWAYKDCQGQTTCAFVKVKTETQNITHTYYAETKDLGNHVVESERITIWFEGINQPPVIDDYVPEDLTPEVDEGQTLHFEVWAHDPDNDPLSYLWKLDGQEVSTISSYDYNPDYNSSGYHDVYVIVYDNKGGEAVLVWNVSVVNVLLNTSCFLEFDPQSPIDYGTPLNASCYCTNPEAPARLWRNGTNIDNENNIYVVVEAGLWNYTCNVSATQNYNGSSNSSLYLINPTNHTIHLTLNGQESDLSVPYNTTTNATGWLEISQGASNAILYRNSQVVAVGSPATEIANLGVGLYNYTYYYPASQNYTEQILTRWLNVTQGTTVLNLSAQPGWNVTYPTTTNVSCTANNLEVILELYRNGQLVNNPDIALLGAGTYNYVCNTTGSQNWTAASINNILRVNQGNSLVNLTLNGIDSNITVNINELVNMTGYLIVPTKINPVPNVTYPIIDGMPSESETDAAQPRQGQYEIWLFLDRQIINIGNYTVTNTTSFNQSGLHNVTIIYPGSQNYSNSYETHWINVSLINDTEPPVVNLEFPLNNSITNENVTVIYNVTDNMDLLLDCNIWSDTSGIWQIDGSQQTSNASSNNWNYFNLPNGLYVWNVECIDDALNSAFAPENWTFVVNASGDVIPPNVWNVSATPQFINQSETTQLEAFARDNVAVDSVIAQVTYPDLTQNNFTMNLGMIVDQYLYDFSDTIQIGNYSVRIFANDTSNNWNTTETTWFFVQAIPGYGNTTTIITQPNDNAVFNLSDVFITEANITAVGGDVVGCNATITFTNGTVLNTTNPVNVLGNIANGTTVVTQWNVTAAAVGSSDITVTTTCQQGGSSSDTVYNITVTTIGDIEPPVIMFVPPTPANNSVIGVDYVYVNTSITDNVAVDTAILDWDGANFTMAGAEPNYWLNVTSLADGTYIYRVYANDTSNNWNASEIRWVIVNTTTPNQAPNVTLLSPPNGTIFHNQQNINFSFIATDDNDPVFSCTIFLDNIANQTNPSVQNNTATNFTIAGIDKGQHQWRVECTDSGSMVGVSDTWIFIIALHDVEIDTAYPNSINGIRIDCPNGTPIMDDPANLTQGQTYAIRYRIYNNGYPEIDPEQVNVTIWLINSTDRILVDSYIQSISQFHLGNRPFTVNYALGQYNISVNATITNYVDINPSDNERNRTINIVSAEDIMPPWWINENVQPPSPAVYGSSPYNFSIEWLDNVAVDTVIFEFDNQNYTPTCIPALPAADTNCSYVFVDLGVGTYNYRWYANDTSNNWNSTSMLTYVVTRATTVLNLNAQPNWTATVGTETNVTCQANNGEVLLNLYRNNSLVDSGYTLVYETSTLPEGIYNYTCNTTGSQNWTAASASNILNVTPLLPGDIHLWLNGTENNLTVTYNNENLKFNASTLYGNVSIRRNGTLIAGPASGYVEVYENLPVGFYNFTAYSTGDANHSSALVTYFLTINKANSSVILYLNNLNSNITIIEGESINHTGVLNVPTSGNLSLLRNGTQFAFGPSPLTDISIYNNPGYYNITAYYAGNENYTSSQATHFITVLEAIHDISVDSIELIKEVNGTNKSVSSSTAWLYDQIYVKANVSNVGNQNETNINITVEDNNAVVDWQLINLNVGQTQEVTLLWNANNDEWRTVKVKSLPVAGETNLANNEQSQDVRVWKVCDAIDCSIFKPGTNQSSYPLGQPFLARTLIQNLWATQTFYDLKVELEVSSGLTILPTWPAVQWYNLNPGQFRIANWNVTSTTTGLKTLTSWAGNREFSNYTQITIT